ncbi:hypothetical protein [Microbispora triticiradicis]|uniref:hypothetical protein n=1 Tax=Microbispora triticiradicis TaxID=2200763 RepID=UPI001AD6296A|nr:hypothetical protein [Microbispora triticiradicis]MBO4270407.1 hypothetical protein [Microbispora triticiradicis]
MSLAIDVDRVAFVQLADGWHEVINGTFDLDSYEYVRRHGNHEQTLHGGGNSGVCATGYVFSTRLGDRLVVMSGPLTAIVAVAELVDE